MKNVSFVGGPQKYFKKPPRQLARHRSFQNMVKIGTNRKKKSLYKWSTAFIFGSWKNWSKNAWNSLSGFFKKKRSVVWFVFYIYSLFSTYSKITVNIINRSGSFWIIGKRRCWHGLTHTVRTRRNVIVPIHYTINFMCKKSLGWTD